MHNYSFHRIRGCIMKTKEELKKAVCAAIDARRDDILAFADSVAAEPEL